MGSVQGLVLIFRVLQMSASVITTWDPYYSPPELKWGELQSDHWCFIPPLTTPILCYSLSEIYEIRHIIYGFQD